MKASTITLAAVLALSSTLAMAQNGVAANATTRSAMNSIPAKHHHATVHNSVAKNPPATNRLNGNGINSLGVTTNSGRKYNGA